jgi:arylsulfatase A-like enzyme
LDGENLVPWLREPRKVREKPSRIEFQSGNAAVRDQRYRYIRYHDGSEELYDHREDPNEWHNRAADPELAEIKRCLSQSLPQSWATPAPGKNQYNFDPATHRWTEKATGRLIRSLPQE